MESEIKETDSLQSSYIETDPVSEEFPLDTERKNRNVNEAIYKINMVLDKIFKLYNSYVKMNEMYLLKILWNLGRNMMWLHNRKSLKFLR